jgi:DNA-directed RNA polymerase
MNETQRRTEARFEKRNQLRTKTNRPRQFVLTPGGRNLTCDFIEQLADFLAGKLEEKPDLPPKFLREPVQGLDPMVLALAALAPLLDGIFRGWDRDDPSAGMKLKLKVGDDLRHRLKGTAWSAEQRIQAGDWLITQARNLDIFTPDGTPWISDKWLPHIAQLRERMIAADPAYAPLLLPPEPWTGWEKPCEGFRATFVRDWRPETKAAINAAFLKPFEHAQAVNSLAMVPLTIDPVMVDLVDQFAVEVMGSKDAQRITDQVTVAADVADARYIGKRVVWCDYNCDRRGRIYALGHFNFARADHVRALFRFTSGMQLGKDGLYWLEIHAANCYGLDKKSRAFRRDWILEHCEDIKAIAERPFATFDKWKGADKPFAYVAACRELVAAWPDPDNFVTRLPVGFDGSANGIQHLALLVRDLDTAVMVNLLLDPNNDNPRDAYEALITKAVELIRTDPCAHANWWREQFKVLTSPQRRKLLKQPIMTFAYSVTPGGATLQIAKVYKSFRQNEQPPKGAFRYLANKVLQACELELSAPASVMEYICDVAEHCTDENRFMEWTSPSGFPVSNRYQEPNITTVTCLRGSDRVARHNVADGATDEIDRNKVKSAAAPNFVHSLDAAHLVKVVNAAAHEGIMDMLTVHDCFYCLAPQATRLHEIILEELANMYRDNDPLTELRSRNIGAGEILPVPPKGALVTFKGQSARVPFSLEHVKKAKNAFG